MILLLVGLGLACLPTILVWALIVVVFLLILWLILSKLPAPINAYAQWIVLVVALILLLILLIQFAQGGVHTLC